MELSPCHFSGAHSWVVAPRFLETLWAPGVRNVNNKKKIGLRNNIV
jgi:hypothetical protein